MIGRTVPSAVVAGTVALTTVAGLLAVRADRAAGLSWTAVVIDVGVGVVLAGCGLALVTPALPRLLLTGAGLAWLAASVDGHLVGAHQALLLLLLAVVPEGRPPRAALWWLVIAPAVVVTALSVSQPAAALCFAATGLVRWWWARTSWVGVRTTAAVAVGASLLLAGVLAALAGWVRTSGYDRTAALEVYQASLVVVAAALVAATRLSGKEATRAAHPAAVGATGSAELVRVRGSAVRRPELRVLRPTPDGL